MEIVSNHELNSAEFIKRTTLKICEKEGFNSSDQKASMSTNYIEFMLSIKDFGCGIPPDKIDKIFINFGNLTHNLKDNPVGRGLGLSICKSIVEQMGGRVTVTSELGKSTTFSMTFKVLCLVGQ